MYRFMQIYFAVMVVLVVSSAAWSASLVVTPSGNGIYAIEGSDLNQVAGMDLTLAYDSTALGTPTVSWGNLVSGAVKIANTGVPGSIRIAVISATPFSASGQVAQVSFGSRNGSGGITSIMARVINTAGVNIPVSASISANQQNFDALTGTSATATPAGTLLQGGSSVSSTTSSVPGIVTMPVASQTKSEPEPASQPPSEPAAGPDDTLSLPREAAVKTGQTEKILETKSINYGTVLERFTAYKGKRTPAAMIALFKKPVSPDLRQEPVVAISDGSTSVNIVVTIPKGAGSSPNFSLSGVGLVSLKSDSETGALVLKVLPKKNITQASVAILTNQVLTTFPLTLVPPAAGITTKEAAFALFLKDSGAKKPAFDLNNDGVHDGLDDYIYTGHYLIRKETALKRGKK